MSNLYSGLQMSTAITLRRTVWFCAALMFFCLTALFTAKTAQAQDINISNDRFELRLGGFITKLDTDFRLSTAPDTGTDFDLERDLGADNSRTVFRMDGTVRFGSRHRLDLSYFRIARNAERTIDREFTIGDRFFDIDASIESRARTEVYKISYGYMLFRGERYELGPTIGLFVQRNAFRISEVGTGALVTEAATLPLPVIGLSGGYQMTNKLSLRGSADFFFVSFDKYSGSLTDARLMLEYDVFENFGLGIGFNWIDIDAEVENPDLIWDVGYGITGLLAYAKLAF